MLIQMGEQKHNRERNGVLDLRLLNKERVALQVRVKDWKEAVRVSGQLLVDVGSIESCYICLLYTSKNAGNHQYGYCEYTTAFTAESIR